MIKRVGLCLVLIMVVLIVSGCSDNDYDLRGDWRIVYIRPDNQFSAFFEKAEAQGKEVSVEFDSEAFMSLIITEEDGSKNRLKTEYRPLVILGDGASKSEEFDQLNWIPVTASYDKKTILLTGETFFALLEKIS